MLSMTARAAVCGWVDARDMRRQHDLGMAPEGMAGRQRFGIGDVDDGAGEMAAIERVDQGFVVELRAAAGMDEAAPRGSASKRSAFEEAARFRRQRQQADQNIGFRQQSVQADWPPDSSVTPSICRGERLQPDSGKPKGLSRSSTAWPSMPSPSTPMRRSGA